MKNFLVSLVVLLIIGVSLSVELFCPLSAL